MDRQVGPFVRSAPTYRLPDVPNAFPQPAVSSAPPMDASSSICCPQAWSGYSAGPRFSYGAITLLRPRSLRASVQRAWHSLVGHPGLAGAGRRLADGTRGVSVTCARSCCQTGVHDTLACWQVLTCMSPPKSCRGHRTGSSEPVLLSPCGQT
jgi:hypothetical protein